MKKAALLVVTLLSMNTFFAQEQEKKEDNKSNLSIIIKPKLGFGELKIKDNQGVNGFHTGFEFLLSSKLNDKYSLDYGFGLSQFKANYTYLNNFGQVKNENIYVPISLVKKITLSGDNNILFGLGFYGNYLYKTEIGGLLSGKNYGFNIGSNIQIGAQFKLSEETSFRIMIESLNDLTNFDKAIKFKQIDTNLISFGLIHQF